MKDYIIVKITSEKCWNVYLGDVNGVKYERSLTDIYFSEEEARSRAVYMTTFNDVVGILFFDEVR